MATRPKAFLKQPKSKSKKAQQLDTADDFQAAGVEFEDAAGKWRAGDAVKSVRFFQRAIEVYTQGLERHSQSFDLAYNKARVELELATHPILVKQLQQPVLSLLEQALQSHRIALSLDPDNADTLFNTAQVLTSIAEEVAKDEERASQDSLQLLEEALQLQARCMSMQEIRYDESQQLQQQHPDQTDTSLGANSTGEEDDDEEGGEGGGAQVNEAATQAREDQWFTVVEPVTIDVLIDSVIAQLNTLTTLCSVLSNSPESVPESTLPWIEEFSTKLVQVKLPILMRNKISADDRNNDADNDSTLVQDVALSRANFISALLEAGFRTNRLDVETYRRERDLAYTASELEKDTNVEALFANARSLFSFNAALVDRWPLPPPAVHEREGASDQRSSSSSTSLASSNTARLQWTALSTATTEMAKASKIPAISAADQSRTHFYRADAALLEYMMSLPPIEHPPAITNQAQLLKNAAVFYRNASKLADGVEERHIAGFRCAVAQVLSGGDRQSIVEIVRNRGEVWVKEQMDDMLDDGLVPADFAL